jgi:hypothetical protein
MIKTIRLRNFRGYRNAELPLKPLTVLLGPNSAGKSSFGQALAALSYANWNYPGGQNVSLTPKSMKEVDLWPVDLGSYSDLVTSGVSDKVFIGLETSEGWVEYGFGPVEGETDQSLRLSFISHPGRPETTGIQKPAIEEIPAPLAGASNVSSELVSVMQVPYDLRLTRKPGQLWVDGTGKSTRVTLDGLLLTALQHSDAGTPFYVERGAREDLRTFFEGVSYLRAARKRPTRLDRDGVAEPQKIGHEGEYAASILHELASSTSLIPARFPNKIPETVEEAATVIDVPWREENLTVLTALNKWLEHLSLASSVVGDRSPRESGSIETKVTLFPGAGQRNITEVGYGVSQVLPILLLGLTQRMPSTLIVELPEAHLHPRAQAALADFFCAQVTAGSHILVETHSEMFFHRLRLRAAMNAEFMKDIAIYFCDAPTAELGCTSPRPIRLDIGESIPWPSGFLQEGWEMEEQISAIREARRKV